MPFRVLATEPGRMDNLVPSVTKGAAWPSRQTSFFRTGTAFSKNQTQENAPALDRPGNEVIITDRTHPFFGQCLPVVYRKCPGRRDHVLVQLPSGVRRAVPVAATSLAGHISGLRDRATSSPALISIRTLLPLALLVRALNRRALEVPDAAGDRSTSTDKPITPDEAPSTSDLARTATGKSSARSARASPARPPTPPGTGRSQ
jgi:hypothetical protein